MKYIIEDINNLLNFFIFSAIVIFISFYSFKYNLILGFFFSLIIFSRLQIYFSEILHEATHYNFFRTYKLNDYIVNILLFPFLLITVKQNRKKHFLHHGTETNNFFTKSDVETFIFSPNNFKIRNIFEDLIGVTTLKLFFLKSFNKNDFNFEWNLISWGIYACFFWIIIIYNFDYGLKFFITWGISALTIYSFLSRVRIYLMHKGSDHDKNVSRNLKSDLISNLFISKMMLNHGLHHKYPSLPFRNLNKLALERSIKTENALNVIKSFS